MNAALQKPPDKPIEKPLKLRERELLRLVVLQGLTPTAAMRQVDPEAKRPDVTASKILAKDHVRAERKRMEDNALETAGVSRSWIVNELRRVANSRLLHDDGRRKEIHEFDEDTRAAVASIEWEEEGDSEEQQLPLLDTDTGKPVVERVNVKRKCKVRLWNKNEALKELAAIARLKDQENADNRRVGPGLTIIVQQGVQVSNGTPAEIVPGVQSGQRVIVNLPPPAR